MFKLVTDSDNCVMAVNIGYDLTMVSGVGGDMVRHQSSVAMAAADKDPVVTLDIGSMVTGHHSAIVQGPASAGHGVRLSIGTQIEL